MLALYLLAGFVGAMVVNYLADVLPATRTLSRPLWWPLGGSALQKYFSLPRVLVVAALGLAAGFLLCKYPPPDMPVELLAIILLYFALVAVIDIEHRVVLHPVSIAGALVLGAIGLTRHSLADTLIGGVVGFGFMLGVYYLGDWMGRLMARARGEPWEETALGFGDVNLAGVIGLLMGWPGVIAALFVGMLAAAIFSAGFILLSLLSRSYKAFAAIPYAPFLCFGAVSLILVAIYRT